MDATSRNGASADSAVRDGARETGPALEAWYRFLVWLVPALERFPRRQKFLLSLRAPHRNRRRPRRGVS